MQGACGDMGNRQYRQGNNEKELWRVRDEIMEQIDIFAETETPMELKVDAVKTAEYTVHQAYDIDAMKVQLAEDEKKLAAAVTEDDKKLLWSGVRHLKRKIAAGGVNATLRSVIFHLGDLEIITIPGRVVLYLRNRDQKAFSCSYAYCLGLCKLQCRLYCRER